MKEIELPEIAKGGVPIEPANLYPEIRRHAEKNREWDFSDEVALMSG